MARRYTSPDGTYVTIDMSNEVIRLGWYYPEDEDIGAHLGDRDLSGVKPGGDDERRILWEISTATEAARPFSLDKPCPDGFEFESIARAKVALRAVNEALSRGSPLPEWAVKALEAGWRPPRGWK